MAGKMVADAAGRVHDMPIEKTRYSDYFDNLEGQIDATTKRMDELRERARNGSEEERAGASNALIAGAMFRIKRRSHQADRAVGRHLIAVVDVREEEEWSVCNCGFAALGQAPEDFTVAEFLAHPGHRDRRMSP